jgi:spore coat polysaccharide biosynthesis protein SpsF
METVKVLGVLQARVSSKRLPGKVLRPLLGEPMIVMQLERVCRSQLIDKLVLATSNAESDNQLARLVELKGIAVYRGSLDNVLERFCQAALPYTPNHVVRLTGDCPLADPFVIDLVVRKHLESDNDYTSNVIDPSYPDGLDVEVMKYSVLRECASNARLPSEIEHVTPYIRSHADRFRIGNVCNDTDLSHMRWTVDEEDDLIFVEQIYQQLYRRKPDFSMRDVLDLLECNPDLGRINHKTGRNEGMQPSLKADKEFLEQ